jgi:hypothetical protein
MSMTVHMYVTQLPIGQITICEGPNEIMIMLINQSH